MRAFAVLTVVLLGIIGSDLALAATRGVTPGAEAEKWAGVGILQVDGAGFCSAALLDQSTVLTAAHCVYRDGEVRVVDPARVRFLAGWRDGITAAERRAVRVVAHRHYDPRRAYDARNIAADLAIVELDSPIEANAAKAFDRMDKVRTGEPVSIVSFSGRRSDTASINEDCAAGTRTGDILLLTCESYPGMSGAPLFSFVNGKPRIVALVSGQQISQTGENNGIALAVDAPLGRVLIDAKATRTTTMQALPMWSSRNLPRSAPVERAARKTVRVGSGFGGLGQSDASTTTRKVVRPPSSQ